MNVNNIYQMLTSLIVPDNNNSIPHCLCCSQASYQILALDINNMSRCCLSKIYSSRTFTINNQY